MAFLVMGQWMMFCEIVSKVGFASAPVDVELVLVDSVLDPVESHVHGFGSALLDGVVGYAVCDGVIGAHGGWWLGMPHVFKGLPRTTPSWPLTKSLPVSASATDAMTL